MDWGQILVRSVNGTAARGELNFTQRPAQTLHGVAVTPLDFMIVPGTWRRTAMDGFEFCKKLRFAIASAEW